MLLTDEWIDALADDVAFCDGKAEAITIIREAVRLCAERCAEICERDIVNRPSDPPANYFDGGLRHCAAAIREQIKGKPRPHFNPNEGFGPI